MDFVFEFLNEIAGGDSTLVVSAFVFLSAAALAFGIMAIVQVRVAVKRRAAGIGKPIDRAGRCLVADQHIARNVRGRVVYQYSVRAALALEEHVRLQAQARRTGGIKAGADTAASR